jgi:hypothetical protein
VDDGDGDSEEADVVDLLQLIKPVSSRSHGKPHLLDLACNVVVAPVEGQVFPDEARYDYHVMRVTEGPHTLLGNKEDGWGNKFQAGAEVVEGFLFQLAEQGGVVKQQHEGLYKYSNSKLAIVSSASVVMVAFKMGHERGRDGVYSFDPARHELALEVVSRFLGEDQGTDGAPCEGSDLDSVEDGSSEDESSSELECAEEGSLWTGAF